MPFLSIWFLLWDWHFREIFNLPNKGVSPAETPMEIYLECKYLDFCTKNLNAIPTEAKKPVFK